VAALSRAGADRIYGVRGGKIRSLSGWQYTWINDVEISDRGIMYNALTLAASRTPRWQHNNTHGTLFGEAPVAEPDEREVLAQGYLAKVGYCEFSAVRTSDARLREWFETLAREWKEEAAKAKRKPD
jgi:hypothetical protein